APPRQIRGLPRSPQRGASHCAPPPDPGGREPGSAGPLPARGDRPSAPPRSLSPDTYVLAPRSGDGDTAKTPPALAATAAVTRRHRCRRSAPPRRRAARQPMVLSIGVFSYAPHIPLASTRSAAPGWRSLLRLREGGQSTGGHTRVLPRLQEVRAGDKPRNPFSGRL